MCCGRPSKDRAAHTSDERSDFGHGSALEMHSKRIDIAPTGIHYMGRPHLDAPKATAALDRKATMSRQQSGYVARLPGMLAMAPRHPNGLAKGPFTSLANLPCPTQQCLFFDFSVTGCLLTECRWQMQAPHRCISRNPTSRGVWVVNLYDDSVHLNKRLMLAGKQ